MVTIIITDGKWCIHTNTPHMQRINKEDVIVANLPWFEFRGLLLVYLPPKSRKHSLLYLIHSSMVELSTCCMSIWNYTLHSWFVWEKTCTWEVLTHSIYPFKYKLIPCKNSWMIRTFNNVILWQEKESMVYIYVDKIVTIILNNSSI